MFANLDGHHTKPLHCPSHPGLKAGKEDRREAAKATTWAAATGSTLLGDWWVVSYLSYLDIFCKGGERSVLGLYPPSRNHNDHG